MSNDLTLGPLRIANPDDTSLASPTSPSEDHSVLIQPVLSSHSSLSTVTETSAPSFPLGLPHVSPTQESALDFDADSYGLRSDNFHSFQPPQPSRSPSIPHSAGNSQPRLNHRSSMPLAHQAQQQMQYPTRTYDSNTQRKPVATQEQSSRPLSHVYTQGNAPSHSYQYREAPTSADSNAGGIARSGSRSTRQLMSAVPPRDSSRTHLQSSAPANGSIGTNPLPSRRHSQHGRNPNGGSTSTGGQAGMNSPNIDSAPLPRSAEEWREQGAAVIGTRKETDASGNVQSRIIKKGVKDFNFGRTLGEGSYSTVLAATDRQNLKEYAIKVLDKRHIIKEKKVKYVNIERDTLNRLTEHPGVVRLYYTFQDERSLYFVLDLASGGELLGVLKKMGSFDLECTRFYGAEILDSVAYMHSRGIIHRDLKPENVLLDREMHVKITDFGTAKLLPDPRPNGGNQTGDHSGQPMDGARSDRAISFVGTAEYVSPELLRDKNACKASDLWAFGCIIYQLLAGRPPFKAANEYLTFQKILALDYNFPAGFPENARDLVERLLVLDPSKRLPVEHIKNHKFFESVPWGKALWRQKAPRLKPYVPPPSEPIKLNRTTSAGSSNTLANMGAAAAMQNAAAATAPTQSQAPQRRPQLQSVAELPPPSQLDIEWSPVLTNNNERILKLGNLIVTSAPQSTSPNGKNGEPQTPSEKPKFSRFFSNNATKKRERLVLITSSGRLVVAAAGGNEKKSKMDIDLTESNALCKTCVDAKGLTYWSLDTREKYYTFEDPRATTSDPAGSKFSSQEWLDAVEQAREVALAMSVSNSYSGESMLNDLNPSMSSPTDSVGGAGVMPMGGPDSGGRHHLRHTLRKNTDEESLKGRKRFSKRHSKSGLAAVF